MNETKQYHKLATYRNGQYEMLYLTDYELMLSRKRRMKDTEVYSQDELAERLENKGLYEKVSVFDTMQRYDVYVYIMVSLALLCIILLLLQDLF
tara:strand:- start:104 stop:385 length:282 start_codon:yes stop_codon:yes gene_type:complete